MGRSGQIAALGVLLVIDMVLVGLVLRAASESPTAVVDVVETLETDESSDVRDEPEAILEVPQRQSWVLALANDGTMLGGPRGDCERNAKVRLVVGRRGGLGASRPALYLREVLDVEAEGEGRLSVIGADEGCVVRSFSSSDVGKSWRAVSPRGSWFPDPLDSRVLHTPSGKVTPGCDVAGVDAIAGRFARAICADGLLIGTSDGGSTWARLGKLEGAHEVVFLGLSNAVALAPVIGCGARAFRTRDAGRTWDAGGCIASEGIEGLTSNGATLLAQVGGELYTSTNDAQSWTQS